MSPVPTNDEFEAAPTAAPKEVSFAERAVDMASAKGMSLADRVGNVSSMLSGEFHDMRKNAMLDSTMDFIPGLREAKALDDDMDIAKSVAGKAGEVAEKVGDLAPDAAGFVMGHTPMAQAYKASNDTKNMIEDMAPEPVKDVMQGADKAASAVKDKGEDLAKGALGMFGIHVGGDDKKKEADKAPEKTDSGVGDKLPSEEPSTNEESAPSSSGKVEFDSRRDEAYGVMKDLHDPKNFNIDSGVFDQLRELNGDNRYDPAEIDGVQAGAFASGMSNDLSKSAEKGMDVGAEVGGIQSKAAAAEWERNFNKSDSPEMSNEREMN